MANQGIDENLEHTRVSRVISDKRENWRRKSDTVHQYNIAADEVDCPVTRSYFRRQSNKNNNNNNNNNNNINTLTSIGSNSDSN